LAGQLGISRPTLREALQNLEQERIVIRRHGVGTFVARGIEGRLESGLERLESVLELASRQGMKLGYRALTVKEVSASSALCEKLQIDTGRPVTSVGRVIVADGKPVAYMVDLAPAEILSPAEIDARFGGSVLDLLRQDQETQVTQAVADIVAMDADSRLAERLAIEPGRAVLMLEETVFGAEGKPLCCSRNYFVPDYFRFHVIRR
jgi:GntR family transcriptional regulator